MDGLYAVKEAALMDVKEKLYPVTFSHVLYTAIVFLIGWVVTDYFFRYTLFRWIYLGFGAVIVATVYQQGVGAAIPQDAV